MWYMYWPKQPRKPNKSYIGQLLFWKSFILMYANLMELSLEEEWGILQIDDNSNSVYLPWTRMFLNSSIVHNISWELA